VPERIPHRYADVALQSHIQEIDEIFEGTAEIQQLVISRAISGVHIK